jgi:hypothetical protein
MVIVFPQYWEDPGTLPNSYIRGYGQDNAKLDEGWSDSLRHPMQRPRSEEDMRVDNI